ncbi:hypothetical protein ACJX0J_032105, partial [Zea mays]
LTDFLDQIMVYDRWSVYIDSQNIKTAGDSMIIHVFLNHFLREEKGATENRKKIS